MALQHASTVSPEESNRRGIDVTHEKEYRDTLRTLPPIHSIIDRERDTQLFGLGYKRWTDHAFESEPPFVLSPLGSGSWCPRKVVTVHDALFPATGVAIFPLEKVRQSIQLRWLEGCVKSSAEQEFIRWFNRLQKHLPRDISLQDPLLYPTPSESAARFRQRVWALFSLMGSQIHIPDTGLVLLLMVNVRYEPYAIRLVLGKLSLSQALSTWSVPAALLSEDETFEEWLIMVQNSCMNDMMDKTGTTSLCMPNLGATAMKQQGLSERPRFSRTAQPPRDSTVEQSQDVDDKDCNLLMCVDQMAIPDVNLETGNTMGLTPYSNATGFVKTYIGSLDLEPPFRCWEWKQHPFGDQTPPFFLSGHPGSSLLHPRLRLTSADPLSATLGTGVHILEISCLLIRKLNDLTPQARSFLDWIARLQRTHDLGKNITLVDPSIYPMMSGTGRFCRKVWGLLSMISSRVIIPTFRVGCVRLLMIQPDYQRLQVHLLIGRGPGKGGEVVPLPYDSRARNPDTWLETMNLNQYPEQVAYCRPSFEFKKLSREVQSDLVFCFYFANHLFEHAQVRDILQLRYFGHSPLEVLDIKLFYYQLLTQFPDKDMIKWKSWAERLDTDEKNERIVALVGDWHSRTMERKKRPLSNEDPPLKVRREYNTENGTGDLIGCDTILPNSELDTAKNSIFRIESGARTRGAGPQIKESHEYSISNQSYIS